MKKYSHYIGSICFSTLCLISTAYASFKLQMNNNSLQTIRVHYNNNNLGIIRPGTSWTSGVLTGQINFDIPSNGVLALIDMDTDHITGDDPALDYGVLITYQDMDIVGRYSEDKGGLLISVGKYGDVSVAGYSFGNTVMGMTLNDVDINRLTRN
jgi:hypothetical protein